jgi:membrane protein YqaA with SNARE-associated domain
MRGRVEWWALFTAAFLAATVLPVASELPLAVMVRGHGDMALPVIVATAGNYFGACVTYWIARRGTTLIAGERAADARPLRWFRRFGPPVLLLTWLPLVGDALVVLAGASRVSFAIFSVWTAIGKAARYAALAWLALRL